MIDNQRDLKKELKEIKGRDIVRDGDVVNIDYVGRIDGEEFDGGSDEGYDLIIGSGMFIDGFESGLIDHKVGETVTLELTFPENYSDTTKAGVDAEFDVTINSIQEYVVPKLTDQFVTELGIVDDFGNTVNTVDDAFVASLGITDEFGNTVSTVDEFRTYVRNYLIESNESQFTQRLEEAIRNTLAEKSKFKKDVPQAMVERINATMVQEITVYAMQNYGIDLKTYMQLAYMSTEESYLDDIRNLAEENVRKNIIIKAVADKENLSLSDEDFQAELEKVISSSSVGYTSVAELPKESVEAYRESLDKRKVMDFLKSKTTVVAPVSEEGSTSDTAAPAAEAAQ